MGYERFIFWFWESPTTGWHACKVKKHLHFLIICIYFYLICSTTRKRFSQRNFSKPLLCVTLICVDWSDWSISFKAVFVSAVLLCVQPLPGKRLFLTLQKRHLVAKNEFAFSFRPTQKSNFPRLNATSGGQYANVSCWRQHKTARDSF